MANIDAPFGLKPIRHKNGAPYNGAFREYYVPATYATALFIGDPVVVMAAGSNAAAIGGRPIGSLPEINKAAVGAHVSGVIVGFGEDPDVGLEKTYNPASTARIVRVADDPDLIFLCQEDGAATPIAAASVGLNTDLIFTHAGNTLTGLSGVELDSSEVATTNTLPWRVLRLHFTENNALGEFAIWEVMPNLHTLREITGV